MCPHWHGYGRSAPNIITMGDAKTSIGYSIGEDVRQWGKHTKRVEGHVITGNNFNITGIMFLLSYLDVCTEPLKLQV